TKSPILEMACPIDNQKKLRLISQLHLFKASATSSLVLLTGVFVDMLSLRFLGVMRGSFYPCSSLYLSACLTSGEADNLPTIEKDSIVSSIKAAVTSDAKRHKPITLRRKRMRSVRTLSKSLRL